MFLSLTHDFGGAGPAEPVMGRTETVVFQLFEIFGIEAGQCLLDGGCGRKRRGDYVRR
jgi:hypothetical protein